MQFNLNLIVLLFILVAIAACNGSDGKTKTKSKAGDLAVKGKRLYIYCEACHETTDVKSIKIGPHLAGIIDRPVASIPSFAYSDSLAQRDFIWDVENMTKWLKQPAAFVPGTTMVFAGLSDQDQIDAMLTYLKTL